MAQRFIPEIADGDKRVLLIAGEPVPYSLARIPKAGETRGNLAAGGRGEARAADRARARDRSGAGARPVGRGPAAGRPRRDRRVPDRGQRDQPHLLRRDRRADRLRRGGDVRRRAGARLPAGLTRGRGRCRGPRANIANHLRAAARRPDHCGNHHDRHPDHCTRHAGRKPHPGGHARARRAAAAVRGLRRRRERRPAAAAAEGARGGGPPRRRRRRADRLRHLRRHPLQPRRASCSCRGASRGSPGSTCRCWCAPSPTARAAWRRC